MKTIPILIKLATVLITSSVVVAYDGQTYEFGKDCDKYRTIYLNGTDKIYVEYKGKHVESDCNTFKFKGIDKYKICLVPVYFSDTDCDVTLKIKSSLYGWSNHEVTCSLNKNEEYCGSQDDTVYMEFSSSAEWSSAKFKFTVTAKKVDDNFNESIQSLLIMVLVVSLVLCGSCAVIAGIAQHCPHVFRRVSQERVFTLQQGPFPDDFRNFEQFCTSQRRQNARVNTTRSGSSATHLPRLNCRQ